MLFIAAWIAHLGFLYFIIRLMRRDGLRLPACFIVSWIIAYFGLRQFGSAGPIYFMSFEALLVFVLICIDRYRQNSHARSAALKLPEEFSDSNAS